MGDPITEIPKKVVSFETELGSVYKFLPDGRTQRYRQVDEELKAPQDAIVFVPPYERIVDKAPAKDRPFLGNSPFEYNRNLIMYTQKIGKEHTNAKVRIITREGKILRTNEQINNVPEVFLAFMRDGKTVDFTLPVSKGPKESYLPFDTRMEPLPDGSHMTYVHLGNNITKINYG